MISAKYRYLWIVLLSFYGGVVAASGAVQAQSCENIPVLITQMIEPELGNYNLWDGVYGDYPQEDGFISAYRQGDTMIVVGLSEDPETHRKSLMINALDYRGRTIWAHYNEIEGLTRVKKIIPYAGGYWVLAGQQLKGKETPIIAVLNAGGEVTKLLVIDQDEGNNNIPDDLVPLKKSEGYLVASHVMDDKGNIYANIYRLNDQGKKLALRTFRSTPKNYFSQLVPGMNGDVLAVGASVNSYDRWQGWLMSMSEDTNMIWAQNYSRGESSFFIKANVLSNGSFILSGSAQSLEGGAPSAWLAKIDAAGGSLEWERFYSGKMAYQGGTVLVGFDDVISVALNGSYREVQGTSSWPESDIFFDQEASHIDYVRLLTLNSRGILMFSDDYMNARGALASDLLFGHNLQRVIIGTTLSPDTILKGGKEHSPLTVQSLFHEEKQSDTMEEKSHDVYSQNGWALAFPATDPYKDRCRENE